MTAGGAAGRAVGGAGAAASAAGAVPVVRLTEVFRQAAQSRVVVNAHRINQGLMPELTRDPASDFHVIECGDAEGGLAKALRLVTERIPTRFGLDPVRDVQVLCPMDRGGLGAPGLGPDGGRVERAGLPVQRRARSTASVGMVVTSSSAVGMIRAWTNLDGAAIHGQPA